MWRFPVPIHRWAGGIAGLPFLVLGLALAGFATGGNDPPPSAKALAPTDVAPLFAKTSHAANRSVLVLHADDRAVHGWIAGTQNFAGQFASVNVGPMGQKIPISDGNTFVWTPTAEEASLLRATSAGPRRTATVTVPGFEGPSLLATAALDLPVVGGPSVFFLTDRSAYRPGHTLQFVGFLRNLTPSSQFEPIANTDVTVEVTSRAKATCVARLALRSDAFGRIVGEYSFTDSDALDSYTLTANGFHGSARVVLAEYRKSEISLSIHGEVHGGKLAVTMDARDYLNRRVGGTSATFTAEVIRTADRPKRTLDSSRFAHAAPVPPSADDLAYQPDDERLFALAHGVGPTAIATLARQPVARREGVVPFTAEGRGIVNIELDPDWLKGNHLVALSGVMVDETGRENRATTMIPLTPSATRGVRVRVGKSLAAIGETVPVFVEPFGWAATDMTETRLSMIRLDRNLGATSVTPPVAGWTTEPVLPPCQRTLIGLLPLVHGRSDATLMTPGAYKLVCVVRFADGTLSHSETGLIVKPAAKVSPVALVLAEHEVNAGSRLRGAVHTRFAGARLLLTLRDAAGIRMMKPLMAGANGVASFDELLPQNLRYGCVVTAEYHESSTVVHADQQDLFVVPTDRTIAVTATAPETASPGAEVKLDVTVNRSEPIDLVVSVFDESLLRVAGDRSGNVQEFYLADDRGRNIGSREQLARRLGRVTVEGLVARAKQVLSNWSILANQPQFRNDLKLLTGRDPRNDTEWQVDLGILLRLAGFSVYQNRDPSGPPCRMVPVRNSTRLADIIRVEGAKPNAGFRVIGETVLFSVGWGEKWFDPWKSDFEATSGTVPPIGAANNLGVGGGVLGITGGQFGPTPRRSFGGGGPLGGANFLGGFGGNGTGVSAKSVMYAGLGSEFREPMPMGSLDNSLIRSDFRDTVFWSGHLRTDATGKATVAFKLPDSLTRWRVVVTALSGTMHVGSTTTHIRSTRPIMIWPILPRAFAEGDTVRVAGIVHNLTDREQTIRTHLTADNGTVTAGADSMVRVPAHGNQSVFWTYQAGSPGWTNLQMSATCAAGSDAAVKRLAIHSCTVEEVVAVSGVIGKGKLTFLLPVGFDPAKATGKVTVAPTIAADMADTLPYLVEYPHGCVEQTMSRFLPALLTAQILNKSGLRLPELEAQLPAVVAASQKRLLQLQQADGGWGWYGASTTHELMTAYALLGLLEAERLGYPCSNPQALRAGRSRLQAFLEMMKPSWQRPPTDKPGRDPSAHSVNDSLYCLYVLARNEAVPTDWWPRIEGHIGHATMSDYGHALALELAVRAGQKPLAKKLAAELQKRAQRTHDWIYWTRAGFTRWADNTTEVTAAVLKALVAHDASDPLIPGILSYFQDTKRGNRWDSTKDTAVVLYALCDYLSAVKVGSAARGTVTLTLNGGMGTNATLDGPLSATTRLSVRDLRAGPNTLTMQSPASAAGGLVRAIIRFTQTGAADITAQDHGIKVARVFSVRGQAGTWSDLTSGATVPKGSFIRVRVTATPTDDPKMEYVLIESPKPACGETIPADDTRFVDALTGNGHVLREDRDSMSCFHYESCQSATAGYVFLAEFPGEFRVPPARAERLYRPSSGGHTESFVLKVAEPAKSP